MAHLGELVLPALERRHDVLAVTLAGHAGGPPISGEATGAALADAVERAMDDAGFETAHLVGNSLGGYLALRLAARGRAESVVALAPAGGWAQGDDSYKDALEHFVTMHEMLKTAAPQAGAILAAPAGPAARRSTRPPTSNTSRPSCSPTRCSEWRPARRRSPLIDHALREGWPLDPERISCPVRIVWGTPDKLLPWPSAAARFRKDWLPHADWVELEGIGHCPQLDVPLETAQLILGYTSG